MGVGRVTVHPPCETPHTTPPPPRRPAKGQASQSHPPYKAPLILDPPDLAPKVGFIWGGMVPSCHEGLPFDLVQAARPPAHPSISVALATVVGDKVTAPAHSAASSSGLRKRNLHADQVWVGARHAEEC